MSVDERYYEQLIAPIEDQMIRSIWRVVRHPDDAEDAMQEALETIWRKLPRVRRHPNPQALVLRICINTAYDVLRKRIRIDRREALTEIDDRVADPRRDAREELAGQEKERAIMSAIGMLSRQQATAVLMRIVQSQPYKDIADALDCSEATARVHVKRGREHLAKLLAHLTPTPTVPNAPREVSK